ncbi:MAG TPA: adenylate/guanylate cyclase domain-containing protein [Acidimicrobiales bacterium]|nr:adenylate/guanylate cyclase domain-containing protein [Acidimicrobiales bacterium]
MSERPVVMYARAPDGVNLAYHVTGEGSTDLLFMPSLAIPIDLLWDEPGFVRFAKRLGRFSRTIWCDARGFGASGGAFVDSHVDDVANAGFTAVLDAAGCERTALVSSGAGGAPLISFAASHPNRVSALVLIDSYAHYVREADYPLGIPPDVEDRYLAALREQWGTTGTLAPSRSGDETFRAWYLRCTRLGIPPEQGADLVVAGFKRDVRGLLPRLTVPTLVLHREGDRFIRVGAGRYLGEHIPGARYVELPGEDHLFFSGDTDATLDEIEEFLTGTHQAPDGDVVTTTILFTDIVSSTEQAARMGHRKWTALTDAHDAMVRAALKSHRGREVKTTGDGFLASFDATTRAVRAALDIVAAARGMGLEVRAGVHVGDVEVRPGDVLGLPVTIAKRICDLGGPGHVLVSEPVKALLVGSGIATSERGTHVLKGVPDEWRLFAPEG